MAVNLDMLELKQKCLQFLIARDFKDLTSKNMAVNVLTEISFIQLIKQALSKESGGNANKFKEYEDLVLSFFQNKAITYSQQFFNTSANMIKKDDKIGTQNVVVKGSENKVRTLPSIKRRTSFSFNFEKSKTITDMEVRSLGRSLLNFKGLIRFNLNFGFVYKTKAG